MNRPTNTLNPNTGREIQINGVRFWNLLKHGFKYDEKLNRLYDTPLPPGTTKYFPKSRMLSTNNRSMILGGSAYNELIRYTIMTQTLAWRSLIQFRTILNRRNPSMSTLMSSSTMRMAMRSSHSRDAGSSRRKSSS